MPAPVTALNGTRKHSKKKETTVVEPIVTRGILAGAFPDRRTGGLPVFRAA